MRVEAELIDLDLILSNYRNFIFDLDGTIVRLNVDWDKLRKEIDKLCKRYSIEIGQSLARKVDILKPIDRDLVMNILMRYEQVDVDNVSFEVMSDTTVEFIKRLDAYYVITNNLSTTAEKVLSLLGIMDNCRKIIGIDIVSESKPSVESFCCIKGSLLRGRTIYIGDSLIDEQFAGNCGIDFMNIRCIKE